MEQQHFQNMTDNLLLNIYLHSLLHQVKQKKLNLQAKRRLGDISSSFEARFSVGDELVKIAREIVLEQQQKRVQQSHTIPIFINRRRQRKSRQHTRRIPAPTFSSRPPVDLSNRHRRRQLRRKLRGRLLHQT